jgi:hypothetical protein
MCCCLQRQKTAADLLPAWSTIWSVYPSWPYFGNGLMYAFSPWSGHYTGLHTALRPHLFRLMSHIYSQLTPQFGPLHTPLRFHPVSVVSLNCRSQLTLTRTVCFTGLAFPRGLRARYASSRGLLGCLHPPSKHCAVICIPSGRQAEISFRCL